jgi:hypothetical protein
MSRRISRSQDALGKRVDNSAERLAVWVLNIEQRALFPQLKVIKVPGGNNMNLAAQAGLFTVLEQEGVRGAPFEGETSDLYLAGQPLPPPLLKVTLPLAEAPAASKLCTLYGVTGQRCFPITPAQRVLQKHNGYGDAALAFHCHITSTAQR